MLSRRRLLASSPGLLLALGAAACTRVYEQSPTAPSKVDDTPPPPKVHTIEFRVNGPFQGTVNITLSNSMEGTTQVASTLPWFAAVNTVRTASFLSLEARAFGFGDLTVQIFVDGALFREAVGSGVDPQAAISGSWSA